MVVIWPSRCLSHHSCSDAMSKGIHSIVSIYKCSHEVEYRTETNYPAFFPLSVSAALFCNVILETADSQLTYSLATTLLVSMSLFCSKFLLRSRMTLAAVSSESSPRGSELLASMSSGRPLALPGPDVSTGGNSHAERSLAVGLLRAQIFRCGIAQEQQFVDITE